MRFAAGCNHRCPSQCTGGRRIRCSCRNYSSPIFCDWRVSSAAVFSASVCFAAVCVFRSSFACRCLSWFLSLENNNTRFIKPISHNFEWKDVSCRRQSSIKMMRFGRFVIGTTFGRKYKMAHQQRQQHLFFDLLLLAAACRRDDWW